MKETQCQMVLQYMNDFGSITTMDAFMDLGCTRLPARISDLKDQGYKIADRVEVGKNRCGRKVNWKRYWIDGQ